MSVDLVFLFVPLFFLCRKRHTISSLFFFLRIRGPPKSPLSSSSAASDVYKRQMYAQIIDDTVGKTLVSASTLDKEVKAELEKTNNVEAAAAVGTVVAKRALEKGIKTVCLLYTSDAADEEDSVVLGGRQII